VCPIATRTFLLGGVEPVNGGVQVEGTTQTHHIVRATIFIYAYFGKSRVAGDVNIGRHQSLHDSL
jgi:hypothetical protein